MFRFKSKSNDKIKINDLNIEVSNKWIYLSDKQFLTSKNIKKYIDQLIVETDNDQYKIKKDDKISIKEENKMFVVNPPQDKKSIDITKSKEEPKNVEDIKNKIQEQINKITKAQEENSELIKKLTKEKIEEPKNEIVEEKGINNNEKGINKIEKASKRGRPHKKEVTQKEDNK